MSFLLDALRKSEREKHIRDVPSIHSTQPSPGRAQRIGKAGPLILVLLPAFLVLLWFGMQQVTVEEAPQDPVAGAPTAVRETRQAMVPEPPPGAVTRPGPQGAAERGGERPAQAVARTPVEDYTAPAGQTARDVQDEGPPPAVPERAATPASTPDAVTTDGARPPGQPALRRPAEARPYQPPRPGVIGYWQLPESVRGDLPEFRISVLVYSEVPENRFILLNGKRQLEGDSYQPGLELVEIRRDGAVFSFRRYQFLVSR